MKVFLYKAGDKEAHRKFGEKIWNDFKEGEFVATFKKKRNIRSISANNFYWVVVQIYASHTGHTKAEIDNMFRMARHFEVIEYPSGKREKIPKETHDLDTKDFSIVVNNLLQWGMEEFPEVIVPRKEDLTYEQWMEVENQYNRTFSGW